MDSIYLSSRLSPSDWAHLTFLLNRVNTITLEIGTEVDWQELETLLIKVPKITKLSLNDYQWDKIIDLLTNVNNKELELTLYGVVEYSSEIWDSVKRIEVCKDVTVNSLRISEGWCEDVRVSTANNKEIEILNVNLQFEDDVRTLHHLVSQYQSWTVGGLNLTELGCDDWAVLAELLPTLTSSVWWVWITTNSTYHPPRDTLSILWHKTEYIWWVNNEKYKKRNGKAFDKMMNKHFK